MHDKSRLLKGTGASIAVVAMIGLIVVSTGTAFATSVAGVGGFTVEADEIRIEGLTIYPGTTDTSGQSGKIPAATQEMQSVEIDGLYLNKTQSLPMGGQMKMTITATGTVTSGQQVMKATYVEAGNATLHGQVIDEQPQKPKFAVTACGEGYNGVTVDIKSNCSGPDVVLKDVHIRAHYLATDRITLPGQKIIVSWDKDGDGDYEQVFGA